MPNLENHGKTWVEGDIYQLATSYDKQERGELAEELGRSITAIASRYRLVKWAFGMRKVLNKIEEMS